MSCESNSDKCKKCQGKSLGEIVTCYRAKFAPELQKELEFLTQGDSELILKKSCESLIPVFKDRMKMHDHQCRVGKKALKQAHEKLQKKFCISDYGNFVDLHKGVFQIIREISRIGPLAVYDISLRLAFSVSIYPEHVYLHAGALKGAINLKKSGCSLFWSNGRLETSSLPKALSRLKPYEIENLLCTCKNSLARLQV